VVAVNEDGTGGRRFGQSPIFRTEFVETMMKTLIKAAVAATVATGLFASPALAANSATAPFTAKAKIVKPLTLTKAFDLDFGTITMGPLLDATGSKVVVGRTGGATTSCGTNLTCSPNPVPASFDVTGVALQQLNISLSNVPGGLINTADATKSVAFTVDPDTTVTLDTAGAGNFDIGGSITVTSATADGDYKNTVDVTVAYQ
jgi:hypothetical protein